MKKTCCIIAVVMFLVCSGMTVGATAPPPVVRLPTEFVTMLAKDSQTTWFNMTISDIPDGYDVTNGLYAGWCCEKSISMTRSVSHTVILHSSYDPQIPESFTCGSWPKVNYVLNHKQGGRQSIEDAIWHYTCADGTVTDPDALAMIADADANGADFIPQPGQLMAILVEGVPVIQRTFFEYTIPLPPQLGDLVWNDLNENGIQDPGEPGLPSVTVNLYTGANVQIRTTTTDLQGHYGFSNLISGTYFIEFVLPSGYQFSPQGQGGDIFLDSDANPSTGRTMTFPILAGGSDTSWDAGMYQPSQQGGSGRLTHRNHAPTADGTAGEPYNGFVGENVLFNGSRSYDRDGSIISWFWSFGDGTNGSGAVLPHVYMNPGRYRVSLTVTDDDRASDTYETVARIRLPNSPPSAPLLIGPTEGYRNTQYSFTAAATDPDGESVQYQLRWGDGTSQESPFFPSGSAILFTHQWSTMGAYTMTVIALDESTASSAATTFTILIDMHYVYDLGYLMNTNGYGPYDMFHSNSTGKETAVEKQGDWYYIDVNGDGTWDYLYNIETGELKVYQVESGIIGLLLLLIGLIGLITLILFFVAKRKNVKVYEGSGGVSSK